MRVVLPLNGAINKDANPLYIDSTKGEVLHRKNCRVTSVSGGRDGINTSIKGMDSITPAYPSTGTNKIIGFVEDKERDQAFYFLRNSLGYSKIYKLKGTTITELNFSQWVLDFQPNEIIDAVILGDNCIFTSDYNPPRKIDVTLSDYSDLDLYDIQLAVRPPMHKPEVVVASNILRKVNKLVGKTFQFATMYIYDDYTYSVLSPYSDLVVSSAVFSAENNTYTDNNTGNYVHVSYQLGTDNVKSVRLLAREGNIGNWFIVEEYEKPEGTTENSTRTYPFYNDVARKALVEKEALGLYSDVPRTARTVTSVQNRIGLGYVKKGYDKINGRGESPVVQYSVEYEDIVSSESQTAITLSDGVEFDYYYVDLTIPSGVAEGDVVSINIFNVFLELIGGVPQVEFQWGYLFNYTVGAGEDADTVCSAIQYDFIARDKYSIIYNITYGSADSYLWQLGADKLGGGVVRLQFVGVHDAARITASNTVGGSASITTTPTSTTTYKSGSYYNVGVSFYDEFGRTSGVLNPQSVYIPHAGERTYADAFNRARIKFTIPSETMGVPEWAKYYRFAITESVNFSGVYPFVVGNATDNIKEIFLDGKEVIAINMPTNLQYEFEKGDYLQIEIDNDTSIGGTIVKTIIGTRTEILIGADYVNGFWLIVPKGVQDVSIYEENVAYIYRTKNKVEDLVYFEDSRTYDVVYGGMYTHEGYVGEGDAWYVLRKFEWGTDPADSKNAFVEDFYINVDDALRAYSKGRPTIEIDSLGEITLNDFVWSFNYLDNTKVNGISTFNPINRIQLDEKDGQIQRVRLVGDVLKVLQDNKETSMYVGKAQISDASGNMQLVKSNDFIGALNPSNDDYGTRYPLSVVVDGRNMFYWDGDQGLIIQSSPNGQHPVSDYGMRSEFLRLKDLEASRVLAYYDKKNGEYVITFDKTGLVESWAFNDSANAWVMQIDLTDGSGAAPEFYGRIGTQLYSFLKTNVWTMETSSTHNTFFGAYKPLSVRGVVNISPTQDKALKAIKTDSNRAMSVVVETPITETNEVGQKTVLYPATFRLEKGIYTSAVFKNILQAGGVENLALIHTGNDIVGKFIEIEFTDNTATEAQIRLVTANLAVNG